MYIWFMVCKISFGTQFGFYTCSLNYRFVSPNILSRFRHVIYLQVKQKLPWFLHHLSSDSLLEFIRKRFPCKYIELHVVVSQHWASMVFSPLLRTKLCFLYHLKCVDAFWSLWCTLCLWCSVSIYDYLWKGWKYTCLLTLIEWYVHIYIDVDIMSAGL